MGIPEGDLGPSPRPAFTSSSGRWELVAALDRDGKGRDLDLSFDGSAWNDPIYVFGPRDAATLRLYLGDLDQCETYDFKRVR